MSNYKKDDYFYQFHSQNDKTWPITWSLSALAGATSCGDAGG